MTPSTLFEQLDTARDTKLAKGQSFRLTDFLWEIVAVQQMTIDTPEERAQISADIMSWYDRNISSYVPELVRDKTRAYIKDLVDTGLVVASKIGPNPTPPPTP